MSLTFKGRRQRLGIKKSKLIQNEEKTKMKKSHIVREGLRVLQYQVLSMLDKPESPGPGENHQKDLRLPKPNPEVLYPSVIHYSVL